MDWLKEAGRLARHGAAKTKQVTAEAVGATQEWWNDPSTQTRKDQLVSAGRRALDTTLNSTMDLADRTVQAMKEQTPVVVAKAGQLAGDTYTVLKGLPDSVPVQGLAQWWAKNADKVGTTARITVGVASFGTGALLGHAFPDFDIPLLGIGGHRNWFFHSALPTVGLGWVGNRMVQHYNTLADKQRRGEIAINDAKTNLIMDLERYIGAPFVAGFAVGSAMHLSVDGLIQNGKDVVGFPVGELLSGGRTLDALYLFGNGMWAFSIAGKFLAFSITGKADTEGLREALQALPGVKQFSSLSI